MTILELYNRLETLMKCSPTVKDNIVGIRDENFRGMGGTPIFPLKSINNGIDWNRGKAFMTFEEERQH